MSRRSTEVDFVPAGNTGLDLVTPEIMLASGALVQADNVVYEPTNVVRKRQGYSRYTSAQLDANNVVRSGWDFWYRGPAGTLTQRVLAGCGGHVYYVQTGSASDITPLGVSLDADTIFTYVSLNSIVLIFNDQDSAPWYWNGSDARATVLTGTGVRNWKAGVKHRGRIWAYGDMTYGDDVAYCADSDPLTWSGADAGTIPIEPGDGDSVVAISSSIYDRVLVFKGPNHGSVHQISGWDTDTFAVAPVIDGIRVINQKCLVSVGSTIFAFSDRGLHDFSMTQKAGEIEHTFVSYPIHPLLKNVNFVLRNRFSATFIPQENALVISLSTGQAADTSSDVDTVLLFNIRNQGWSVWPNVDLRCVWRVRDPVTSTQVLLAGADAGYLNQWFQVARSDNGTGIGFVIKTPRYILPEHKPLTNEAVFLTFSLFCMPTGAVPLVVSYQVDNEDPQGFTLSGPPVGDAARLGIDFVLGDGGSRLGGPEATGGFICLQKHWTEAPQGRTIQFTISNSGNNQDVAIYGWSLRFVPTGEDKGRMS